MKLSEGGIRDVEFFVQSLQLVWGGRKPDLRCSRTLDALDVLCEARLISPEDKDVLGDAYKSLRTIEHRLQMQRDEQTHTVPKDEKELEEFALFCGFETKEGFVLFLEDVMSKVWSLFKGQVQTFNPKTHDKDLVRPVVSSGEEDETDLERESRELFAGFSWHGDEKIEGNARFFRAIAERGYERPEEVLRIVQGWYKGQNESMMSDISRRFLLDVLPTLLRRFSKTRYPQEALTRFDKFVSQMPVGFSIFSIFGSHPQLMEVMITVIGSAPKIAHSLSERPFLLYALLTEEEEIKESRREIIIEKELEEHLHDAKDEEDVLVLSRRYLHEEQFRCEWAWLKGTITQEEALKRYSSLHESVLKRVLYLSERQNEQEPVGELAVWAFGRLGHQAMMPSSDYDLVFAHKATDEGEGKERAFAHYQRLVRRAVAFIESKTREGVLGQVDLRLRPYGKSGALSQTIESLRAYYLERKAWPVEYMALCHARAFYGSSPFVQDLESLREESLRLGFKKEDIRDEVKRVLSLAYEQHKGGKGGYSVKYAKGGLFDLEFFTQYGLLLCAREIKSESIPYDTLSQLGYLSSAGIIDSSCEERLKKAWRLMTGSQAFKRLTGWHLDESNEELRDVGLKKMLRGKGSAKEIVAELSDDNDYIRALMAKEKIMPDIYS